MDNTTFIVIGISILIFESIILLVMFSNLRVVRRLGDFPDPTHWPSVSVLVPARNEENNIESCVQSLLNQDYPNLQIWVLDDHSTDNTWQILTRLAACNSQLKILKGESLPPGWLGKHWACHQLAQAVDTDLLLFTDADTRHHPATVRKSVSALTADQLDMLTALPREEVITWGEKLIVPLISWSIFTFVPLWLAYRLPYSILSAAIGQFMLFRREAYRQIGGHEAVRQHAVDDLALGRRIKVHRLRWRLLDGTQHVYCRMYRNFGEVYEGISKNLFAAFEYGVPQFLFVWNWLGFVFWMPLLILLLPLFGWPIGPLPIALALTAVGLALFLWGIHHLRFGYPWYLALLYPITILLAVTIAIRSMALALTNRATWKGRTVIQHRLS